MTAVNCSYLRATGDSTCHSSSSSLDCTATELVKKGNPVLYPGDPALILELGNARSFLLGPGLHVERSGFSAPVYISSLSNRGFATIEKGRYKKTWRTYCLYFQPAWRLWKKNKDHPHISFKLSMPIINQQLFSHPQLVKTVTMSKECNVNYTHFLNHQMLCWRSKKKTPIPLEVKNYRCQKKSCIPCLERNIVRHSLFSASE